MTHCMHNWSRLQNSNLKPRIRERSCTLPSCSRSISCKPSQAVPLSSLLSHCQGRSWCLDSTSLHPLRKNLRQVGWFWIDTRQMSSGTSRKDRLSRFLIWSLIQSKRNCLAGEFYVWVFLWKKNSQVSWSLILIPKGNHQNQPHFHPKQNCLYRCLGSPRKKHATKYWGMQLLSRTECNGKLHRMLDGTYTPQPLCF